MQKITLSIYEGDLQIIERAAKLWDDTTEEFIYTAALQRAQALLSKQPKFIRAEEK